AAVDLSPDGAFDEDEMVIRLTLVRARNAMGQRELAREAVTASLRRLDQLAAKIVDPAARASFLGNVGVHRALAELGRSIA
ncbi:MAG: hypothetical protein JNK04_19800, partial [Myxococcales bacterium]|nr:hypothetical protein [Myxococcales bacterium]